MIELSVTYRTLYTYKYLEKQIWDPKTITLKIENQEKEETENK
jgi:hypothetical protein